MEPAQRRRHTVLVVDDEAAVVESVRDLLRRDYRVLGATSGPEAIEILAREDVHVILTDQRMPGMTGVELLGHIRGEHPDAVRLLITGYADIRAVIDAINLGNVYRYITKPWDPDELQTVVRDAADRYQLIVERKRLLAELTASNLELEHKNEALEEASALKTAFIRVASHELRSPLVVLAGLAELALREPLEEPVKGYLRRMENAAGRLGRSIRQITTMLAVGELRPHLDPELVDVGELVRQSADDVRPFVELRRQRLEVDVADDVGGAVLDAAKVRDCLDHMLLNSVKFTPDAGSIRVAARRDAAGSLLLVVSDEGVGIDAESLPKVFEPFFTGFDSKYHSSGTYEFGKKGLGLGLSVVRAFVELQGGRVDVRSEPGKGATFTITLPAGP